MVRGSARSGANSEWLGLLLRHSLKLAIPEGPKGRDAVGSLLCFLIPHCHCTVVGVAEDWGHLRLRCLDFYSGSSPYQQPL